MTNIAKRTSLRLAGLALFLGAIAWPAAADVTQLVRNVYYHGIPYELAHAQGPEAVPVLLEMLEHDDEREHWANIVTVLGMIGDDSATEPLIGFLERRFSGPVDPATYRALLEVPTSLGLLAREPDSPAFAYLRDGTSLAAWQGKEISWTGPSLERDARDVLMVRRSITGLGFSGTEAARTYLVGMRQTARDSGLWELVQDNVIEAVQMSERVEELGYERFFDEARK